MGYASTTIVLYGTALSAEQAQKVYDYVAENPDALMHADVVWRRLSANAPERFVQKKPIASMQYDEGLDSCVLDVQLLSDQTDGRVHDLQMELGFASYFGIYAGSKGYAYQDDISSIVRSDPQRLDALFQKHAHPILKRVGIDPKQCQAQLHLLNQVW